MLVEAHPPCYRDRRSTMALRTRRGGRAVECTALEMRHTGNRIGGSNPPLSASSPLNAYRTTSLQAIRDDHPNNPKLGSGPWSIAA